ncbi:hypothetical protein AOLI_G00085210 [Acnodon oligacanthus]
MVAGAAQGLERSRLAEGGQLWGRRGLAAPGLQGGERRCGEAHRAVAELSWVALEALALEGTSLLLPHRCHLDPLTPCRSWRSAKPEPLFKQGRSTPLFPRQPLRPGPAPCQGEAMR